MKRYRDLNTFLRKRFGQRVQKIALDTGLGCPNRDGTLGRRGCLFCDHLGSGSGALLQRGLSIREQISVSKQLLQRRYGARKFIAYLQSFSNTYGPPTLLEQLYNQALDDPDMVGLAVGTRPDCIDHENLALLAGYQEKYAVWLEIGLQSCHDETLRLIRRGHDVACFVRAVHLAAKFRIPVCAHVIIGLPGENRAMMMQTADFLAGLPIEGVKIHLLYVAEGTALADLYAAGKFHCLEQAEAIGLVVDFLERLPPGMVIHRLTGDPKPGALLAPQWAADKAGTLDGIRRELERRNTWQGRLRS